MTDPKSWKAQIAALGTIPHASSNPFVNKIEEFVDALNANPVVRARMTRRQTPTSQILSLRTSPKWIRDRDSTLLYIDV